MHEQATEAMVIQYAMARRQRPLAAIEQIAELVVARLGEADRSALAADAQMWNDEGADPRELARQVVLAYVRDLEGAGE